MLTSVIVPGSSTPREVTETWTSVPDLILDISRSGTEAVTSKLHCPSTEISGTPGLAISPSSINLFVITPLNGARRFE